MITKLTGSGKVWDYHLTWGFNIVWATVAFSLFWVMSLIQGMKDEVRV